MHNHSPLPSGFVWALKKLLPLGLALASLASMASAQTAGTYQITNLISDGSVPAITTDPNFINPWGISIGKDFWINTSATGFDYVALTTGSIPFKVVVPAASGVATATGTPTGTVFTGSASGFVQPNGSKAVFLFSSLDGTISAWNPALGTAGSVAQITVDNSAANAVYTDMALVTNPTGTFILAANFGPTPGIDIFDSSYKSAKLAGAFTDPTLPAGYAPYAVHAIGAQVFVTYAMRNVITSATPAPIVPPTGYSIGQNIPVHSAAVQQVIGPGNGIVSVFDTSGNFVARAITGGNLNAPWGVALAPASFGIYGDDLLVGNFGDGLINVYDPKTFAYLGQLTDGSGKSVAYASLWELTFGTTGYGDVNSLYFSAGLAGESHGLFGVISNNTSATGTPTFGFSASSSVSTISAGSSAQMVVSVAPTNSFSGSVSLSCSGLPSGATCSFSSSQLSVSPTSSATSTVTIQTTKSAALTPPAGLTGSSTAAITAAVLLPFGSFVFFANRRPSGRQSHLRLLSFSAMALLFVGIVAGCSSYTAPMTTATTPTAPGTPAGQSQVTINATAGSITRSTVVAITVQ